MNLDGSGQTAVRNVRGGNIIGLDVDFRYTHVLVYMLFPYIVMQNMCLDSEHIQNDACIHVHIHTCTCTVKWGVPLHSHSHIHTHTHTHTHAITYARTHARMHARTHACTHARMHACMHTCAHMVIPLPDDTQTMHTPYYVFKQKRTHVLVRL